MASAGGFQNLRHRIRRAHPAGPAMRRSLAVMERASADRIRRYQERRLRLLVRLVAARSRYYRRWFAESGVDPRSIRTLDDLPRLPLLDRQTVMEAPADFAVQPLPLMWPSRSSGTSGRPVTVYRTPGSSAFEQAALQRQWGWFGLPRDARRVVLRGSTIAVDRGVLTHEIPGDHQLLVSSFHLTTDALPEILATVRAFRPHAVEGWASSLALLAARLQEAGERLPVQAVITSSETISSRQLDVMRSVFEAPIADHYGQTERVAMAGTCEAGSHHVFPDYGVLELLPADGATGRAEIVGTSLHNWGFPLLRYRTGDLVDPAPPDPCPCGRAFPRLGAIAGRSEDAFTSADGRPIPLPSTILDDLAGLTEAQIAQLAPGRFEVRVVPGPGFDPTTTHAQVLHNVEHLIGPGQEVTVRRMDRLPRSPTGKLRGAIVVAEGDTEQVHLPAEAGRLIR